MEETNTPKTASVINMDCFIMLMLFYFKMLKLKSSASIYY